MLPFLFNTLSLTFVSLCVCVCFSSFMMHSVYLDVWVAPVCVCVCLCLSLYVPWHWHTALQCVCTSWHTRVSVSVCAFICVCACAPLGAKEEENRLHWNDNSSCNTLIITWLTSTVLHNEWAPLLSQHTLSLPCCSTSLSLSLTLFSNPIFQLFCPSLSPPSWIQIRFLSALSRSFLYRLLSMFPLWKPKDLLLLLLVSRVTLTFILCSEH